MQILGPGCPARVPSKLVSVHLLLAIGLKGGSALATTPIAELVVPVAVTLVLGLTIPVGAFFVLHRRGRFSITDAASVAAPTDRCRWSPRRRRRLRDRGGLRARRLPAWPGGHPGGAGHHRGPGHRPPGCTGLIPRSVAAGGGIGTCSSASPCTTWPPRRWCGAGRTLARLGSTAPRRTGSRGRRALAAPSPASLAPARSSRP